MELAAALNEAALFDTRFSKLSAFDGLVIAVSGGADSLALLHLLSKWRQRQTDRNHSTPEFKVATVDHGLRVEAQQEATFVAEQAKALGFEHVTLTWDGDKPASGVQEAARHARYDLMAAFGVQSWPDKRVAIVTAHTLDDQIETFWMRLARGSGLEGLTAMSDARLLETHANVTLVRPLLKVARSELLHVLQARKLSWVEDPSNADETYERVRWRKAQATLEQLGLTQDSLALTLSRLARAEAALEDTLETFSRAVKLQLHDGMFSTFDLMPYQSASEELRVRFLSRLIGAYGGQAMPPRLVKVEALVAALMADNVKTSTLGGCLIRVRSGQVMIMREPDRAAFPVLAITPGERTVWDARFRVSVSERYDCADGRQNLTVRALGREGLEQLGPDHLERHARDALATLPAFWEGDCLVAVPQLGHFTKGDQAIWQSEFIGFATFDDANTAD